MKFQVLILFALALLLVPAISVSAQGTAEIRMDQYLKVNTNQMTLEPGCGATIQTIDDGRGFRFEEHDPSEGTVLDRSGWLVSGCGTAKLGVMVPEGATSLHASYFADRRISTFGGENGRASIQGLRFTDEDTGARIHDMDVFPMDVASREVQHRDSGAIPIPSGVLNASLEFYFQDVPPLGNETGSVLGATFSGRSFAADVHDIEILVHGRSEAGARVTSSTGREGGLLLDEMKIHVEVPEVFTSFQVVPRILVGAEFDFESLRLPNGDVLTLANTWNGSMAGPASVLVERTEVGLEITLNPALIAEAGPGDYLIVTQSTQNVRVSPVLIPVAILLMASPLPFAVLAILQARGFYREAFGSYRVAARNLMIGVVGVFVYYVAVLVSAFIAGRLDLMGVWPLPLEGVLLYVQVAAASAAFVLLWLSARAMYWITRPRPGTARDVKDSAP